MLKLTIPDVPDLYSRQQRYCRIPPDKSAVFDSRALLRLALAAAVASEVTTPGPEHILDRKPRRSGSPMLADSGGAGLLVTRAARLSVRDDRCRHRRARNAGRSRQRARRAICSIEISREDRIGRQK
jgi:hypothetical protein